MPLAAVQSVSRTPEKPQYTDNVEVSAIINDHVEVDQAILSFTNNLAWQNISMNKSSDMFTATIPAQPYNTLVEYKICANDTKGHWVTSQISSYTVCDLVPPEIVSVDWRPKQPSGNETVTVSANITEPADASGVNVVLFCFRDTYDQLWNTTMTHNDQTGLWEIIVPQQPHNSTGEFFIIAYDDAWNAVVGDNSGANYRYNVLVEFASLTIVTLFMAVTLVVAIIRKRKSLN